MAHLGAVYQGLSAPPLRRIEQLARSVPFPEASELIQYEGQYTAQVIDYDKPAQFFELQLTSLPDGALQLLPAGSDRMIVLTLYADDYVINESSGMRSDFLRDRSSALVWLRYGGRLYRRGGSQPQGPVAAPSDEELLPDSASTRQFMAEAFGVRGSSSTSSSAHFVCMRRWRCFRKI